MVNNPSVAVELYCLWLHEWICSGCLPTLYQCFVGTACLLPNFGANHLLLLLSAKQFLTDSFLAHSMPASALFLYIIYDHQGHLRREGSGPYPIFFLLLHIGH